MKVIFLKQYKHTFRTFKKGDVVKLDPQFSAELIKKKIVEEFTGITDEDVAMKKLKLNKDGN